MCTSCFFRAATSLHDRFAHALTHANMTCAVRLTRLGWLHIVAFCSLLCSLLLLTGQLGLLLQRHCLRICFQALICLLPSLQLQPVKPAVHLHVQRTTTPRLATNNWAARHPLTASWAPCSSCQQPM